MSYEAWKAGLEDQPEESGFDAWSKKLEADNIVPPQTGHTKEMNNLAYTKYFDTVKAASPTSTTAKAMTRETFISSGEANKWINSGATRNSRSHFANIKESFKRGDASFKADQRYYDAILTGDRATADRVYKEYRQAQAVDQLDPIAPDAGIVRKMTYGAASILPGIIEGGRQSAAAIAAGATMAAVAGQLGPQVAAPEELITVPGGALVGFKLGSTLAWYKQGAGSMMMSMRDNDVDSQSSEMIAGFAAIPYALVEQLQVDHLIPGIRQGANKVISKTMAKVLAKAAKKYGTTLGSEVAEEVVQEGIIIIAEDLAEYLNKEGFEVTPNDLRQRASRLWGTAKESAISMALLPIPGAIVDVKTGQKGPQLVKSFESAGYNNKQAGSMAEKISEGVPIEVAHKLVISESIADLHNATGGSTVDKRTGRRMSEGFPVGIGEEEVLALNHVSPEVILQFEQDHAEALSKPNRQVGTWFDEEEGKTHIEVVEVARTEEEAIKLGEEHNELAIYNLETGKTIELRKPEGEADAAQIIKPSIQINPDVDKLAVAVERGTSMGKVQQKLDDAEVRFRNLSEKKETTHAEEQELQFLAKNRTNAKALLDRDEQPIEGKRLSKKQVMDRAHNLADLLGYDIVKSRALNKKLTGKESMKDMVPAQREQIMMVLEHEAKELGLNVEGMDVSPVGEMMTKLRERKQRPSLSARDRRMFTGFRKALHKMRSTTSYYFQSQARMRRATRALDNYENDGPFMRNIFNPVKKADVEAVGNFTAIMEETSNALREQGINPDQMMTEVIDIGIDDKLATSERIGVYALSKNEKTYNHLTSMFDEDTIAKIVESVEANEKEVAVAEQVTTYFEQQWPQFEAVANAVGIKGLVKEDNYITAFITDRDEVEAPDFLEGLTQTVSGEKIVPGKERTKKRKKFASREIELDIFAIHARAARSVERFKVMAPVAHKVGSMLSHKGFRHNLNNATYGHGAKIFQQWLQDSVRGKAAYDSSAFSPMIRALRTSSVNYVLGFKITTALKQGGSLLTGMAVDPKMVPLVIANMTRMGKPGGYTAIRKLATDKSEMLKNRDWDRDLRATYDKKQLKKFYKGKGLSPIAMKMTQAIDKWTTTTVWWSGYQLAQGQGMNEKESVQFADGIIQDTQPMGSAVDLPMFFRGGELAKAMTIFQNQVNQNGNYLWHNILGEAKAKKINLTQASYRLLVSQVLPALLLGLVSRGRPPESAGEVAKDLGSYLLSPFVFVGGLVLNIATGEWGRSGNIAETPFKEAGRLANAIKQGDAKKIVTSAARTTGAWTGGKIPLQAIQTAEGAWDLATGETEDWRELVWSEYSMKSNKKKDNKGKANFNVKR
jgi:hypothetical protein